MSGKDAQRRDDAKKLVDIIGTVVVLALRHGRAPTDSEYSELVDDVEEVLRNAEGRAIEP